jgi:CRP/FNR family nitrogen fixation transcriptional regulator
VISGAVRTHRILRDGRRQIDEFHFAGDYFGIEMPARPTA